MATETTNLHLKKPQYSDSADIKDINDNMDSVDATFQTMQLNMEVINTSVNQLQTDLNTMDAEVDQVNDDIEAVESSIEQIQSDVNALDGSLDSVETRVLNLETWKPSGAGTANQVLRTNGDGTTRWDGAVTQQEIIDAAEDWLDGKLPDIDDTLSVPDAAAEAVATSELILVSQTQPVSQTNKLWIVDDEVTEYVVPTMDDLHSFEQSVAFEISDIEDTVDTFADGIEAVKDVTCEIAYVPAENTVAVEINDGYASTTGEIFHGDVYDAYGYTDKFSVKTGDILKAYNALSGDEITYFSVLIEYDHDDVVSGTQQVLLPYTIPSDVNRVVVTLSSANKNARITITRDEQVLRNILEDRVSDLETDIDTKAADPSGTKVAGKYYGLDAGLNPAWIDGVSPANMIKCELVSEPKSDNIFDINSATIGYLDLNGTIYNGGTYDTYCYLDLGEVEAGDVFNAYQYDNSQVSTQIVTRWVCYDSNGDAIASSGGSSLSTFTVPQGVSRLSVTVYLTMTDTIMLLKNNITPPAEYIPYHDVLNYYVAGSDFIPESATANKVDKDGTGQVTLKNCEFMYVSPNMFDTTDLVVGLLYTENGSVLANYTTYRTSQWLPVDSNTAYTFSNGVNTVWRWCWYTESKTFISGDSVTITTSSPITRTSPANAAYIRIGFGEAYVGNDIQLEKGSIATEYMPYGTGHLLPQYAPKSTEEFPLNLPPQVYASIGTEMNFYFDNMVDGYDTDYDFDVTCSTGMQLQRGYRVVATAAGTYPLTITAKRKRDGATVTKQSSLIVATADVGTGITKSIIVLGDSTTAYGTVIVKLHDNFQGDPMSIETLGTQGTSPYNHEGRSGWSFNRYFTVADGNAFYNPTSETFDADYYFTNSGVALPDYFIINLGINDMFGAASDTQLNSSIESAIDYCDTVIESVQTASPDTTILICLTIPCNYTQDGFGKEYGCGQTRQRCKRNNILWVQRQIAEYGGRESEGIYLVPINLALDTVNNMGAETDSVNARNISVTYRTSTGNGAVHPAESGYWQIADMYKAFLKANL